MDITIMEKQMDKKMENETETRLLYRRFIGSISP